MSLLLFLMSSYGPTCMHSVVGGLTKAAPMSHDAFKFNSNCFNNLRFITDKMSHHLPCLQGIGALRFWPRRSDNVTVSCCTRYIRIL